MFLCYWRACTSIRGKLWDSICEYTCSPILSLSCLCLDWKENTSRLSLSMAWGKWKSKWSRGIVYLAMLVNLSVDKLLCWMLGCFYKNLAALSFLCDSFFFLRITMVHQLPGWFLIKERETYTTNCLPFYKQFFYLTRPSQLRVVMQS